ncbi:Uncharacterized protein Rs2_02036 [Raphanus sativus]|nr:Uncharacterized protein Rs2_02036 [Raphanus sativus]
MATSEQGSSMIDVEDLVKARVLEALLAGSKVVVNKASNNTSSESSKKKKYKSRVVLPLEVLAIILAVIIIICVIDFFYEKHKTKKAQSLGQEKADESSKIQTSKTEDVV